MPTDTPSSKEFINVSPKSNFYLAYRKKIEHLCHKNNSLEKEFEMSKNP